MLNKSKKINATQTLRPDEKAVAVQLAAQRAEIENVVHKGAGVVLSTESNESERPRCPTPKTETRRFERSPAPSPPEREERRRWEESQVEERGPGRGG